MTPKSLEDRLRQAYRDDAVWAQIAPKIREPRDRPGLSPVFAVLLLALVAAVGGLSWLTGVHPIKPTARVAHRVQAMGPGPVLRMWNTNVQQLAAYLATHMPVEHPSHLYWSTVSVKQLRVLFPHLGPGRLSSSTRVHLLVLTGQVFNAGPPLTLKPLTFNGLFQEGSTRGGGYEIFSLKGTLLAYGAVSGLSSHALKAAGLSYQQLFWPANWGYRLWASPWGQPPAGPFSGDPRGTSYVVVSRQLALSLDYPERLTTSGILKGGLPAGGPLYLIETPGGASWFIDGTTGARFPDAWPGGWFPLTHYGTVRAAVYLPASGPPGT